MMTLMKNLRHDERGATAIEYALIGALISVTIIFWGSLIGTTLNNTFQTVANAL